MWQIVAVTWSQTGDIGLQLGDYQIINYQNLAAVITASDYENIEHLSDFERIDALFVYQSILEKAGINRTIIPIRFGTIVKKKRDIALLLEKNARKFRSLLRFASNKAEFDLMGIWKKKVESFDENIFKDLEEKGYEVKPHQPINRAICFHVSILLPPNEQQTFTNIKEDLDKKFGDRIDVRISEPLPPHSFFTIDINRGVNAKHKKSHLELSQR